MESLIFVDSNIWCYYFDRSAQEHNAVSERLEQALEDGVAINTVVAMEVAHYRKSVEYLWRNTRKPGLEVVMQPSWPRWKSLKPGRL
jgi:predicted nucleic acid-binding protein